MVGGSSKANKKSSLISDFFIGELRRDKENQGGFGAGGGIGGKSLRDLDGVGGGGQSATSSVRGLAMKKVVRGAFGLSNRKSGGKRVRANEMGSEGSGGRREVDGNLMEEERV